ncbi:MAG: CYTH domain-containing protein [Magnetococcales bacterium]|nr:CYTH domain-containing protein [Magnetococcales bacterium]MBF0439957.1 CYTH domain-containing protein [Magnetococcales bacterium]
MPFWEEEIKLAVPSNEVLEAMVAAVGKGTRDHSYRDVYKDSADHQLLKHGLALRERTQGGERRVELKGAGTSSQGVVCRPEWQQVLLGELTGCLDLAEGPVRSRVLEILTPQTPLLPLFRCLISRRSLTLPVSDLGLVEISFDHGEVCTDQRQVEIREVEVELLAGSREAAIVLADDLAQRFGLTVAGPSKFLVGLTLLGWKGAQFPIQAIPDFDRLSLHPDGTSFFSW